MPDVTLADTAQVYLAQRPIEDYAAARGLPLHHARRELLETLCEATYVGTAGARGTRERWTAVHEPTRHRVDALVSREETPAGRPLAVVVEIEVRGV